MSFAGDLEHLPIVDVIQLLHATKKTGTLYLRSHKGESQLAFNDGYIVSANHVHNNIRIGQILVEMDSITPEQLEQALHLQTIVGAERKPLIATLIEGGHIDRQTAFSGLETLIELTIVEILTWNSGTFALDVDSTVVCDEYRYFPETLKQDIFLNTQNILMDALRIYDEKMRDGTLQQGTFLPVQPPKDIPESTIITPDILGLEDLDSMVKKIPDVFLGLKEYDATEIHRQKLRETVQELPQADHDRLLSLLLEFSGTTGTDEERPETAPPLAVIIFTSDTLIEHLVSTVCKHEGIFVFSTDDGGNLDLIIDQSFAKELVPLLVIDAPLENVGRFSSAEIITLLQQKREKYPHIAILQLVAPHDCEFPLCALQSGVRTILTRPVKCDPDGSFVETAIKFMKTFHLTLQKTYSSSDQILRRFKECIHKLGSLRNIPEVAFVVLEFASAMFERTITFVVANNELIAEKGFGIQGDKSAGATPPLLFTIPLEQSSVFQDVIGSGHYFYGQCNDAIVRQHLHSKIGTPHIPKLLLMPIKTFGKVIALIYGDFGVMTGSPLQIDLLDIAARHAGLLLDNNLYRKKLFALSQPS
ncbi:MAG: DUF4388 domain-containing protein [Desulfuromonadales bacterium]|nr:DUF4388 domain-containing protein [Desulfuromonadales bacterium]